MNRMDIAGQVAVITGGSGGVGLATAVRMLEDGAKVIASAFADLGFEVHMGDLFETSTEVAEHVAVLNVDAVGVSSLAAGHKTLVPELIFELQQRGLGDVTVIVGGVIPEQDYDFLRGIGVAEIFGPGTNVLEAAFSVLNQIEGRLSNR